MLNGKRILLVISGGIAAYKTLELIRRLKDAGAQVRPVMTAAAAEFVTPLSVAALAGEKVSTELFDLTDEVEMGHIELSRSADLIVVAPASADIMARMATGQANDLATTLLLATDTPVLLAPAMNVRMWDHPATQRNVATLQADGVQMVGPNEGDMACGEYGPGRMAEVPEIISAISAHFSNAIPAGVLDGKHVIVTSGPTQEPIDPVRYISNHSSGKQGHAIAAAAAEAGARVTLIKGPVSLPDPPGVKTMSVTTASEMLAAVDSALPADVVICAAAVADWRVADAADHKLKKTQEALPTLSLTENPDILATVAKHPTLRPDLVIGFAAETETVLDHAQAKLARKGCDWILANDVASSTVFGSDENTVHLVTASGVDTWPTGTKSAIASRLITHITTFFHNKIG